MHSPLARCWRQLGCRVVPSGEYLRACLLLLLGVCFVSGKLAILDAAMMDANGEESAGVGDERSQQEEGSGGWAGRDGRYVWSEEISMAMQQCSACGTYTPPSTELTWRPVFFARSRKTSTTGGLAAFKQPQVLCDGLS